VVDEDEFEEACRTVPYPPEIAAAALRSRDEVRDMLEQHAEPFHSVGWAYLNASLHR
jgi:protein associated with RNAse G/E